MDYRQKYVVRQQLWWLPSSTMSCWKRLWVELKPFRYKGRVACPYMEAQAIQAAGFCLQGHSPRRRVLGRSYTHGRASVFFQRFFRGKRLAKSVGSRLSRRPQRCSFCAFMAKLAAADACQQLPFSWTSKRRFTTCCGSSSFLCESPLQGRCWIESSTRTSLMCSNWHVICMRLATSSPKTAALRGFLHDIHKDTWFKLDAADSMTTVTQRGTRPGSPLADIGFNLLMSKMMWQIGDKLHTMPAYIQGCQAMGVTIPPLSWVDDLAVPIAVAEPSQLLPLMREVVAMLHETFQAHGMTMNFESGKSEAVVMYRGSGAAPLRTALFDTEAQPKLVVSTPTHILSLCIVATYRHLGARFTMDTDIAYETKLRAAMARQAFEELKRPLFLNKAIPLQGRLQLYNSLVIARLMYGCAAWDDVPRTAMEQMDSLVTNHQRRMAGIGFWSDKNMDRCRNFGTTLKWLPFGLRGHVTALSTFSTWHNMAPLITKKFFSLNLPWAKVGCGKYLRIWFGWANWWTSPLLLMLLHLIGYRFGRNFRHADDGKPWSLELSGSTSCRKGLHAMWLTITSWLCRSSLTVDLRYGKVPPMSIPLRRHLLACNVTAAIPFTAGPCSPSLSQTWHHVGGKALHPIHKLPWLSQRFPHHLASATTSQVPTEWMLGSHFWGTPSWWTHYNQHAEPFAAYQAVASSAATTWPSTSYQQSAPAHLPEAPHCWAAYCWGPPIMHGGILKVIQHWYRQHVKPLPLAFTGGVHRKVLDEISFHNMLFDAIFALPVPELLGGRLFVHWIETGFLRCLPGWPWSRHHSGCGDGPHEHAGRHPSLDAPFGYEAAGSTLDEFATRWPGPFCSATTSVITAVFAYPCHSLTQILTRWQQRNNSATPGVFGVHLRLPDWLPKVPFYVLHLYSGRRRALDFPWAGRKGDCRVPVLVYSSHFHRHCCGCKARYPWHENYGISWLR